ncbi:MAG TPA: ATP-dependent RecD-like DNA helicase [Thermoanaerobaculia bacterium]|nr:ATP-dependent RecD-like DNA helicase [Thermoanaerobaculia bacterium]
MTSQPDLFTPDPPAPGSETLEGTLERVVYASPESAWCVVRLRVPGRLGVVTAVGALFGIQPGEQVKLTGRWMQDSRYGEQFAIESWLSLKPATLQGLEKYLGSGLVPGLGPVMAKRLVAHFGLDTLEVIEGHPERLTEVPGIGRVRSRRIQQSWGEQKAVQQVMIFLQSHGVSTHHAVKIYRTYGDDAMRVVGEDPYRLATDVYGIGFRTADRIAERLGIPRDAPQRLAAGVLHALGQASEEGHLFLPRARLVERSAALLEAPEAPVAEALERLRRAEQVMVEPLELDDAVYLRSLFLAELGAARRLLRLQAHPVAPVAVDLDRAFRWLEETQGLDLAAAQREAVRTVLTRPVVVITGGPGTGKTTLVRALVEIFSRKGEKVLLAAPTGRAAKRLADASGREAVTLHRLLEFAPQSMTFDRNAERPLGCDLLVVDELSMVDMVLAHHLLKAVPEGGRLVLVGDADQLPSVGPGNVLADLLQSGVIPAVRLRDVFRQARESLIVTNAHRILAGELPRLPQEGRPSDFFFIERESPEEAISTLEQLVGERIPRGFGFDPWADIQVLSPMRRGPLGTHAINASLQALLNPGGRPAGGARGLCVGDKVMQLRNNYQLEVFNGDLGRVEGVDEDEGELLVRFEDRVLRYAARDLDELELAYACSIHKSQGSEYPCVVVLLHGQHHVMLQRNLLYTALTRGRRLVVLLGSRRAVAQAVRNHSPRQRHSLLAERLRR